ncbi:MAG TPA: hypothetical protein VK624_12690 [Steroidobacteraceae bacterium]|nr:hypothetical protein [Steroidobacteraceae bacterium]
MDTDVNDAELIARLKRLDLSAGAASPPFGYDTMLERHGAKQARARRRQSLARGTASVLVVALVAASVWRLDQRVPAEPEARSATAAVATAPPQPRIVRANTYLGVAALEDHIASFDDALTDARLRGGSAEVARLERTRNELLDSYAQVRYAEMVSANF